MRITRTVYPEITKSLGVSGHITPVSYKKQLVAGLNYFVKVKVSLGKFFGIYPQLNDSEYAHLRIFVPLGTTVHNLLDPQHTPSLVAIEDDHTRDDDITYFSATSLKSHAKTQQNV